MLMTIVAALAMVTLPPNEPSDPSAQVRETAYARVARAQALARDAELVKAVLESNARPQGLGEIMQTDQLWISSRDYPLRKQIVARPCSARMRRLLQDDTIVVEAFTMDGRGALVCATGEASDYWQGDEPKWQKTFQQGHDVWVEEPALDASTGMYAVQLSVPMRDGSRAIGALTLTLKVRRRQLTKTP
jgi:hypothetical protein